MTHADAFLQAILDAPDDDVPRLLFADWLEEQGDPDRAEFIRVQIALESGKGGDALLARQYRLLRLHEAEWSSPAHGVARGCIFRRGFIEEVEADAAVFLDGAVALFRLAPVRRVRLSWVGAPGEHWAQYVPRLAESPFLERLRGLDLSRNLLGNDGLLALLISPWLTGLRELALRDCQISDRGVRVLAAWPLLTGLTRLDLSLNDIGPGAVRALARDLEVRKTGGDPPRLAELLLHGNPLGEAGRRAILTSPVLRRAVGRGLAEKPNRRFV